MSEPRVTATISVGLSVENNGQSATISPDIIEIDLTDLVKLRGESLARHMLPMRVEQAAGEIIRRMLTRAGLGADHPEERNR